MHLLGCRLQSEQLVTWLLHINTQDQIVVRGINSEFVSESAAKRVWFSVNFHFSKIFFQGFAIELCVLFKMRVWKLRNFTMDSGFSYDDDQNISLLIRDGKIANPNTKPPWKYQENIVQALIIAKTPHYTSLFPLDQRKVINTKQLNFLTTPKIFLPWPRKHHPLFSGLSFTWWISWSPVLLNFLCRSSRNSPSNQRPPKGSSFSLIIRPHSKVSEKEK